LRALAEQSHYRGDVRRVVLAGADLCSEQQTHLPDMDMGIVEAGDKRAPGEVNAARAGGRSGFDFGQRANSTDASIVADEDSFGHREVGIYGVDDAIVEE
jgi:hypothetical protein